MKAHLFLVALSLAAPGAWSQQPAELAQERARIDAERSRIMSDHAREEQACYQRFAVSGCLNDVRARRRVALEALRRQENRLDDADRRRRGAEQLHRIEEKSQTRATQQEQGTREGQARQAYEDKQARARRKQQAGARTGPGPAAVTDRQDPAGTTRAGADGAQREAARQAYEDKLKRLEERRQRRDKLLEEKKGKPDRRLPLPD